MRPRTGSRLVATFCRRSIAIHVLVLLVSSPAHADAPPSARADALRRYQQYLMQEGKPGPATIPLQDQAVLALPAYSVFLPLSPAKALMQRMGNKTDGNFLGMIMPWQESDWFITIESVPAGYVSDDDAKNWNADDLLKSIRANTDKDNLDRKSRGIPGLEILGWVEKPRYDSVNHRLVWSILARQQGAEAGGSNIVNYRMLALGRQGYIALVMVADSRLVPSLKPTANALLSDIKFDNGKRYTDFNASTDHVAAFGLAALIGGVVAHKLGFFALIAAFLAKGAKIIAVAVVGAFAGLRRLFRRNQPAASSAFPADAPPPSDAP